LECAGGGIPRKHLAWGALDGAFGSEFRVYAGFNLLRFRPKAELQTIQSGVKPPHSKIAPSNFAQLPRIFTPAVSISPVLENGLTLRIYLEKV